MKKYHIAFIGRVSGAIGKASIFSEVVEAENLDDALLCLYDGKTQSGTAYDTISKYKIVPETLS
jgi:hypothetical protein